MANAERLRRDITGKKPWERQELIISATKEGLKQFGGEFSTEYYFKDDTGKKTRHYLIFVSKHELGYNIMKDIMHSESTLESGKIGSFGYRPPDPLGQQNLFATVGILELGSAILSHFAGRTLTCQEVFEEYATGRNLVSKNIKDALRKLEEDGKIIVNPSLEFRRKIDGSVTFGDNVSVRFPEGD